MEEFKIIGAYFLDFSLVFDTFVVHFRVRSVHEALTYGKSKLQTMPVNLCQLCDVTHVFVNTRR